MQRKTKNHEPAETNIPVLVDCCVFVRAYQGDKVAANYLRTLGRKQTELVVPTNLVSELCKVIKKSRNEIFGWINKFAPKYGVNFLEITDNKFTLEAEMLVKKYCLICHYPDNIYLAICKLYGASLVTYDKGLKSIARIEGVLCFSPGFSGRFYA